MDTYISNNLVRVSTLVTIAATGVPIDPTTISLYIITPDGKLADYTSSIVHDSVGNYHYDYLPTQFGVHTYQWTGTGAAQVCDIEQFLVVETPF